MNVPDALPTDRLVLRPMAAADAADLERQWNEPEVGRFLWDGQAVPRARVDAVIAASEADFAERGFGLWTIHAADQRAGFCGLRVEADTGRVELLYALDPRFQGRGLAAEAARAVLADAFSRRWLPRVYAGTNRANAPSVRVLERAGLRRIGSRPTAVEELLVYVADHPDSGRAGWWAVERARAQAEGLPRIMAGASEDAIVRRSPSGKWSAHENLAHLARQQQVFLERMARIRTEPAPALPQYRAEEDGEWPAWAALRPREAAARFWIGRGELLAALAGLTPAELERTGVHARFGAMPLLLWIEFFLDHEAHHLYTMLRRVRGAD
jgi:RimJ/RimL family protein N-acetyltransferase